MSKSHKSTLHYLNPPRSGTTNHYLTATMRSLLFIIPTILINALAIPTPQADPIRTAPSWRIFEIADLKGPGCPDLNSGVGYRTHMNGGHNTVDGSEIYYAMVGYPHLRARLDEGAMTASTWCETTLTYKEYTDRNFNVTSAAYRLKPHKNGTEIGAVYDLDEGVNVNWKFTYEATGSKKVFIQSYPHTLIPLISWSSHSLLLYTDSCMTDC